MMPRAVSSKDRPSAEYLRSILNYDPMTGALTWKARSSPRNWNKRWAGKPAGSVKDGRLNFTINGYFTDAGPLIWCLVTGEWPTRYVDHKNGIGTDVWWTNLRLATHTENQWNRTVSSLSQSGIKGVYPQQGKWLVRLRKDGTYHYLGYFDTMKEAEEVSLAGYRELHGEFALSERTVSL